MQYLVNKALTRWAAASMISGHSLTLVTTGMGVQGTTKADAGLEKQQMHRCLQDGTPLRAGVSTLTETGALPES